MTPKVMIVLLSKNWVGIARLPHAMTKAGWEVATFCADDSYLAKTVFTKARYKLETHQTAFSKLIEAVNHYKPDILIPGCEITVGWFHKIARFEKTGALVDEISYLKKLVRLSLGSADLYDVTLSKNLMHSFALKLGLRVPLQETVTCSSDAKRAAQSLGYPVVIKGEFGFSGNCVRICKSELELEKGYKEISASNPNNRIDIQKFIDGVPSMCDGVAHDGRLLESFFVLKVHTHPLPTSPSSVVLLKESMEAQSTLSALVKNLSFNGFCSCDFIIEKSTQALYLIEFNPRPVPLSSLGHIFGHDLCVAFSQSLGFGLNSPAATTKVNDCVALFPNEWLRDIESPYLTSGYHDVPWNDPILLKALAPPSFTSLNKG